MMRYKVGDRPTLLGASLQWWDEKGKKIVSFSSDIPGRGGRVVVDYSFNELAAKTPLQRAEMV
jgi:hypothetical protein